MWCRSLAPARSPAVAASCGRRLLHFVAPGIAIILLTIAAPAAAESVEPDQPNCTIHGTGGPDSLEGKRGKDVICARGGDDVVFAAGAGDIVLGGSGDDELHGQGGPDDLVGGGGEDVLDGGPGANECRQNGSGSGFPGLCVDYLIVDQVRLSTHEVNTFVGPRPIDISLHVTDSRNPPVGINGVFATADTKGGLSLYPGGNFKLTSGTPANGTWTGRLNVPERIPRGVYSVGFGIIDYATSPEGVALWGNFEGGAFGKIGDPNVFRQLGEGGHPPRITDLSVTPNSVDTSAHESSVSVSAKTTRTDTIRFDLSAPVPGVINTGGWIHDSIGDGQGGFRSRIYLPRAIAHGRWQLRDVVAMTGTLIRRYQAADLERLDMDSGFDQTGNGDRSGPTLDYFSISPTVFTYAQDPSGYFDVSAHATDDYSGIQYAELSVGEIGTGSVFIGTETYNLDQPIQMAYQYRPPAAPIPPPGVLPLQVRVVDGANNASDYSSTELAEMGFPWAVYNAP
jgi:hypothetical protein